VFKKERFLIRASFLFRKAPFIFKRAPCAFKKRKAFNKSLPLLFIKASVLKVSNQGALLKNKDFIIQLSSLEALM
jgi:hypothetical protein